MLNKFIFPAVLFVVFLAACGQNQQNAAAPAAENDPAALAAENKSLQGELDTLKKRYTTYEDQYYQMAQTVEDLSIKNPEVIAARDRHKQAMDQHKALLITDYDLLIRHRDLDKDLKEGRVDAAMMKVQQEAMKSDHQRLKTLIGDLEAEHKNSAEAFQQALDKAKQ